MARTSRRNAPRIEALESRQVLSAGGPTDQAQYMLEVLNLVRTNPTEGAKWVRGEVDATIQANIDHYGVNLDEVTAQIAASKPRQPLAWDARLAAAAQQHSEDMATKGYQSHDQENAETRTPEQRIEKAGYGDRVSYGENAFAYTRGSGSGDKAVESAVDNAMQAFLLDWGVGGSPHRNNIMQPDKADDATAADVGLGIADVTRRDLAERGFGPKVVTQVFGRQAESKPQIVGVVYEDTDKNGRFSYREGRGDVEVSIESVGGGNAQNVKSWDAGGYQTEVNPGTYRVSARSGRKSLGTKVVEVNSANVKVDFELGQGVEVEAPTPVPAPTPVRTPQATRTTPAVEATRKAEPVPVPVRVKSVATTPKLDLAAMSRVFSSPSQPAKVTTEGSDLPKDAGYAVSVNLSTATVASQVVVATKAEATAVLAQSEETTAPAVEQVIGSGVKKDWLNSKVIWGQGWKASTTTDLSR